MWFYVFQCVGNVYTQKPTYDRYLSILILPITWIIPVSPCTGAMYRGSSGAAVPHEIDKTELNPYYIVKYPNGLLPQTVALDPLKFKISRWQPCFLVTFLNGTNHRSPLTYHKFISVKELSILVSCFRFHAKQRICIDHKIKLYIFLRKNAKMVCDQ